MSAIQSEVGRYEKPDYFGVVGRPVASQTITGTMFGNPLPEKLLNVNRSAAITRFVAKQYREPSGDAD